MILILGGTTEGRLAVRVADAAGSPYWYSTRGDLQQIECKQGTHITGALDESAMSLFCTEHDIRLLVDAAHPFAEQLHRTVASVAESLDLPVVRVERNYPDFGDSVRWCDDYAAAVARLETDGITRLLALTGVQTIGKLKPYWSANDCWFRILRREESLEKAREQGFPEGRLVYYEEDDEALDDFDDDADLYYDDVFKEEEDVDEPYDDVEEEDGYGSYRSRFQDDEE